MIEAIGVTDDMKNRCTGAVVKTGLAHFIANDGRILNLDHASRETGMRYVVFPKSMGLGKRDTSEKRTDKERLDFLQVMLARGGFSGRCVLRDSTTGRGFRLHETQLDDGVSSVRQAIDNYMDKNDWFLDYGRP